MENMGSGMVLRLLIFFHWRANNTRLIMAMIVGSLSRDQGDQSTQSKMEFC